jgi:phosphatidylglycerol:prolipoprotein diacylglycerol transferase
MIIEWGPSPEIFSIGPLTIRWYGVFFATSFIIGYRIMEKIFKEEGFDVSKLDSLLLHIILGTTIGARLGHCLFYEPGEYLANPIRILYIWEGGLASHGGTIGNLIACWLFIRKNPEFNYLWLIDRLGYPIALAACFIRLGNVMNSEILGLPTNGNWGVIFKLRDFVPRHPAQLYEALAYLLIFFLMRHLYWKTTARQYLGRMFGIFVCCVFGSRFLIEHFKENQVPFENLLPFNMGQLLSLPFIAVGIFLIIASKNKLYEAAVPKKRSK